MTTSKNKVSTTYWLTHLDFISQIKGREKCYRPQFLWNCPEMHDNLCSISWLTSWCERQSRNDRKAFISRGNLGMSPGTIEIYGSAKWKIHWLQDKQSPMTVMHTHQLFSLRTRLVLRSSVERTPANAEEGNVSWKKNCQSFVTVGVYCLKICIVRWTIYVYDIRKSYSIFYALHWRWK